MASRGTLQDGGEYGLETLLDARHDENGMVNMIDMGMTLRVAVEHRQAIAK